MIPITCQKSVLSQNKNRHQQSSSEARGTIHVQYFPTHATLSHATCPNLTMSDENIYDEIEIEVRHYSHQHRRVEIPN